MGEVYPECAANEATPGRSKLDNRSSAPGGIHGDPESETLAIHGRQRDGQGGGRLRAEDLARGAGRVRTRESGGPEDVRGPRRAGQGVRGARAWSGGPGIARRARRRRRGRGGGRKGPGGGGGARPHGGRRGGGGAGRRGGREV